jgi:hypothetical protein
MRELTVDCVTCSRSAACTNEPVSAMARKVLARVMFITRMLLAPSFAFFDTKQRKNSFVSLDG